VPGLGIDAVCESGTDAPPVNHAQDARATIKLHQYPGLCLRVGIPHNDYIKFSVMPRRRYGLQPRVASATLGKESDLVINRNPVACALCISF